MLDENSEEYKQMLAEKAKACMALIEKVKTATKISRSEFDQEKKQYVTITEEIPEGVKEAAIEYLMQLATNNYETYTIFHGQDGTADHIFWLHYRDGKISLRKEIDYGMMLHDTYSGASIEEFLYGMSVLENCKKTMRSVKLDRKP